MPAAQLKRLIETRDLACPAADAARCGEGVFCRIEGDVIDGRSNPDHIAARCMGGVLDGDGGYSGCETWRAEHDRRVAKPLVEQ